MDKITYSSIVVPELMEKIPESIRFNMIRGSENGLSSWSLEELLAAFEKELEIRKLRTPDEEWRRKSANEIYQERKVSRRDSYGTICCERW